jgi:hypothetical protein
MKLLLQQFVGFLFCCAFVSSLYSQKEAWNWHFGVGVNMSFTSGSPVVSFNSALLAWEGVSSASDTLGNLLMYVHDHTVYNKLHLPMPNGSGLTGCTSSTQSSLIVRKPGSFSIYYLFTTDCAENYGLNGLKYSIIDLNADNGLGDVITKNELLVSPTSEKITAVSHRNKRDIWIIGHGSDDNIFYSYLLKQNGLDTTPIMTSIGSTYITSAQWPNSLPIGAIGQMKASPNGKLLASAVWGTERKIDMFQFDDSTGILSNHIHLLPSGILGLVYGLEFSPNSKSLYFGFGDTLSNCQFYQADISNYDSVSIWNSLLKLDSFQTTNYGSLQLGPDGKLYILRSDTIVHLDRIKFPDSLGLSCFYEHDIVNIANPTPVLFPVLGLPNFMVSIFDTSYRYFFIPEEDSSNSLWTNFNSATWDIYPNPSHDFLNIYVPDNIEIYYMEILDLAGKIQYFDNTFNSGYSLKLDIKHIPSGIYLISIKSNKGNFQKKFIHR